MPHLLLIVEPVGQRAQRSEAEGRAAYAAMLAFGERLKERGVLMASNSLQSTENAVRLQVRDGRTRFRHGCPGFLIVDAREDITGPHLLSLTSRDQRHPACRLRGQLHAGDHAHAATGDQVLLDI